MLRHPTPYAALCVWAMAADTEAEAARLFSSREMWRLGRDRGVFAALPSPEEAAAYEYSDAEKLRIERLRSRALYGTPAVVGEKLRALAGSMAWRRSPSSPRCTIRRRGGIPTRCWRRSSD